MNGIKQQILEILSTDCRIPLEQIATMVGREMTEVAQHIDELEKEQVILSYRPVINWDRAERQRVEAMIEVRVTPQRDFGFDAIAKRIYRFNEVKSLYLMSGGYDLMVILEGKTLKEVSGFVTNKLSTLDTVLGTTTHFILKKYKDHGTIMDKKEEDIREIVTP